MVYATEETPLGTAGSVRNARDELDERFLVISGDVLTDIDLSAVVGFHEKRGAWPRWPSRRSTTRSSSASSSPKRTARSSGSWRSRPGARCSATPSTPGSSCSSPRSSTSSPRAVRSTSRARLPGRPRGREAALRVRGRRLLGGRGHARRPTSRPTRTSSTSGSRCRSRGSPSGPGCGWARAPRSTRPCPSPARRSSATTARSAPGRDWASTPPSGSNIRLGDNSSLQRSVVHDNAYLGAGVRIEGSVLGRSTDLRQGVRCEEGVVLGDECFVGAARRDPAGRQGVPVQDRRGRGHRQLVDHLGVAGRPDALRPGRGPGTGQRGHQPRAGRAAVDGLGHHHREGGHHLGLPRHQPGRPGAQAGHHGRLQRGGGERGRPGGGHGAGHPVPGAVVEQRRAASPCGWSPTTPSRW